MVATYVNQSKLLIGRISASIEINPHESASRAKVREAMGIEADYPEEELSTNIYRVYEADIIEEGVIKAETELIEITMPSDMPKAGAEVFIPNEKVIANAMGFQEKMEESICLGRTRISVDENNIEKNPNNVLLKPSVIQRHVFVGGTTGSGKSYATGILLEEINKFGIPIIILDSQNEYAGVAEGLGGRY